MSGRRQAPRLHDGRHKVRELPNGRYGVVVDRGRERSSRIIATFATRAEALQALPKLRRAQWSL